MTHPERLVIFDYSGTLSLEAPCFGRPESLIRALAESGLASLGIATPADFWEKVVNPTWEEGSTTAIGYKRLLTERIEALGLATGVFRTEIAAAAARFVDDYLHHSGIDPHWNDLLRRLAAEPLVQTVVATDHYAEATAAITGHLHALGASLFVANSADIGVRKEDRLFWDRLKERLPLERVQQVVIVDDFGSNEVPRDDYARQEEVLSRQTRTIATLMTVFPGAVAAIPFFLETAAPNRELAAARLIAATACRIEDFLSAPAVREDCKPQFHYPCPWGYKVIGRDLDKLRRAVAEVMAGCSHTVTPSQSSKGGAYHCLNLETTVASEPARLDLYQRLRCHPDVLMVL